MSEPVCPQRGKWLGGCRFEPRFDLGAAQIGKFNYEGSDAVDAIEKFRAKTYVRDVCVTCGRTKERQENAA